MNHIYDIINGKVVFRELPAHINSGNEIVELSPIESGIVSALTSVASTLVAGITRFDFFRSPIVQNSISQVAVTSINVEKYDEVNGEYPPADKIWLSIAGGVPQLVSAASFDVILSYQLRTFLISEGLLAVGEALPLWGVAAVGLSSGAIVATSTLAGAAITDLIVDAAFGFQALDLRYEDSEGNHLGGTFLPDGLQGVPEQFYVEQYIKNQETDIDSGTLQTHRALNSNDLLNLVPLGTEFEIYKADFLADVFALTNSNYEDLIALGNPLTKNANDTNYLYYESGVGINVTDADIFLNLPVSINGVSQTITINNVYQGSELLMGGGSAKNLILPDPIEALLATDGDDLIFLTDAYHTVYGDDGTDTIIGTGGNDTILGSEGEGEIIDGGNDIDLIDYSNIASASFDYDVTANLSSGAVNIDFSGPDDDDQTLYNIEHIKTGNGDDSVFGSEVANEIVSGAGEDTLDGGAGNDTLDGGADDDTIYGGFGQDVIIGSRGDDVIDGGSGNDVVNYAGINTSNSYAVDANLNTGTVSINYDAGSEFDSQGISGIENVIGGAGNDNYLELRRVA